MSDCGHAYPEYIVFVTDLGESHGTESTREKKAPCSQQKRTIIKIHPTANEEMMCLKSKHTRVALACQM